MLELSRRRVRAAAEWPFWVRVEAAKSRETLLPRPPLGASKCDRGASKRMPQRPTFTSEGAKCVKMREGCIKTFAAETQSILMLMFDVDGNGIDADVDVVVAVVVDGGSGNGMDADVDVVVAVVVDGGSGRC